MGAMHEEVAGIIALMTDVEQHHRGMRTYYRGKLLGHQVVVVFSRWGKVAAATTLTHLLLEFGITELVFTGLCGGISPELNVGDVVVGNRFYQHDMDATPIIPRYEIPLLGISSIEADPSRVQQARQAVSQALARNAVLPGTDAARWAQMGLHQPQVFVGAIASGDCFIADAQEKQAMLQSLPDVLCVEMEGAAVAQVCYEYGLPFTIVRIVSDASDEQSEAAFLQFASQLASAYSVELVRALLR